MGGEIGLRKGLVILAIAAAFTYLAFRFTDLPFIWVGLVYSLLSVYLAVVCRRAMARAFSIYLAVVFVTFTAFEGYLFFKYGFRTTNTGVYAQKGIYFNPIPNTILGYIPHKNISVDSRKYYRDHLVYDVVYTIDKNGLRISSPAEPNSSNECILFFGGSFTFGEGVDDAATMPYRVGEKLERKYDIYNFAFHGYGPHQMLSALESGWAQSVANCDAAHVFYQAIVDHVGRASGNGLWDVHGPRYVLSDAGVVRRGALYEGSALPVPVIEFLKKSVTFGRILRGLRGRLGPEQLELFLGIVGQTHEVVGQLYPSARFHVILWPALRSHEQSVFEDLVNGLEVSGVDLVLVTSALPEITERSGRRELRIKYDGHPTAMAHERIATYLVRNVIGAE